MTNSLKSNSTKITTILASAAVCALVAGGLSSDNTFAFVGSAFAEDGTGGPDNSQGNQGGQGQGSKGSQEGQGNQGGSGSGQGGPGEDSDSKGPQAGQPGDSGSGGGKPVWAQEGIPEAELGRLSVARSPDQVLERSLEEALANITPDIVAFYSMDLDEMIEQLSLHWDDEETAIYDSPLQSLALFQDAMDGTSVLRDEGVRNDTDTLLAVFLGVASDKNLPITVETVIAVSTILGDPITGTAAEDLAADAEAIRIAVLAGHG